MGGRGCIASLPMKERKLHLAQADDALDELRCQLRMSSTLRDYKRAGATKSAGEHQELISAQ